MEMQPSYSSGFVCSLGYVHVDMSAPQMTVEIYSALGC